MPNIVLRPAGSPSPVPPLSPGRRGMLAFCRASRGAPVAGAVAVRSRRGSKGPERWLVRLSAAASMQRCVIRGHAASAAPLLRPFASDNKQRRPRDYVCGLRPIVSSPSSHRHPRCFFQCRCHPTSRAARTACQLSIRVGMSPFCQRGRDTTLHPEPAIIAPFILCCWQAATTEHTRPLCVFPQAASQVVPSQWQPRRQT